MELDTRQLRMFVTLARELHFTRAARRLFITQPTLSNHVRRLEAEVGATLFERNAREVTLTPAGEKFLVVAQQMLGLVDGFDDTPGVVTLADNGPVGLPVAVLRRLRERHDDLQVSVRSMTGAEQMAAVRAGDLTAAWVRLAAPPGADLHHELVRLEPVLLWRSDPAADPMATSVSRLLTVTPETSANVYTSYMRAFAAHVGVELSVSIVMQASLAASAATAPPGDLFLVPGSLRSALAEIGRLSSPVPWQPYYPWSLVWRADRSGPVIDNLRDVIQDLAQEQGWLTPDPLLPGTPWLPVDDPHHHLLADLVRTWRRDRDRDRPDVSAAALAETAFAPD